MSKLADSLGDSFHFPLSKGRLNIKVFPRFINLQISAINKQDEGLWKCSNSEGRVIHRIDVVVKGIYANRNIGYEIIRHFAQELRQFNSISIE